MTFEEFCENCSFDFTKEFGRTNVLVIFSQGFIKDFDSNFVESNREVAKTLTSHDLYDYLKEQFNG